MKRQIGNHTRNTDPALAPPVQLRQLQSRPWRSTIESLNPDLETSEIEEAEPVQAKFGHNLADIPLEAPDPPPAEPNQTPLQMKELGIGKSGDKYEQEADTVAQKVVSQIHQETINSTATESVNTDLEMPEIETEPESLRAKFGDNLLAHIPFSEPNSPPAEPNTSVPNVQADFERELNQAKTGGSPLDNAFREKVEPVMGADFSEVKVHTDARADQLSQSIQAKAFTTGQDIFFKQGEYEPGSQQGQELLAHELTHVVQQGGAIRPKRISGKSLIQKLNTETEATETEAYYSDYVNESNLNDSADVGTLTESTTKQEEDPNQPIFDKYKGESVNKFGYVSSRAKEYEIAKTVGVNVRAKPDGTLPNIAKVLYGTKVQVQALDNTNAFYFIIADTGAVGWSNKNFVALEPPDIASRLHHITESNLTTILQNEYVDKGLWTVSTGNDYTTLAAAVIVANDGRAGVDVDWEKAQKYKDENTLKNILDPWMIDNFAIYHGSTILKGHNIWLPSPNYVRMLQSFGAIGSRPGWINTAVDIGHGITGFSAGLVSGVFGSLWDTLTGLWELGKGIVDTVKGVLDGSLFASIQSIYDPVTTMTWEDCKNMVNQVITMSQNAFNNFQEEWNHADTYKKWHFRGYTIGAIALEVVLAICTGGAALGAKVLAKIGKYFPKLMKVLNKLLKVADDLDFRRRRGKGRGDKSKDRDRDDDRERDNDNQDMSKADREWEQARVMASLITEQHDAIDTPVKKLIPLLNTTIAVKYGAVKNYKAIPIKGDLNAYKIIQMSRKNSTVDRHYTENKKVSNTHFDEKNTQALLDRHKFKYDELTGLWTKKTNTGKTIQASLDAQGRWVVTNVDDAKTMIEYSIEPYKRGKPSRGADNFFQAHHPLQDKWGKDRLSGFGYNSNDPPSILLRDRFADSPHRIITNQQASRKSKIPTNTFLEERKLMQDDLKLAGVPERAIKDALKQVDEYYK